METMEKSASTTRLQEAQNLVLPSREAMLNREPSVQFFWDSNRFLLSEAWSEWEQNEIGENNPLNTSLLDSRLRESVELAWKDVSQEKAVEDLWDEVAPGVYQAQFFNPERLAELRGYLDKVADAKIPLRPPYGIALNRGGAMLDQRSEGYLAAPGFQEFYQELMDKYMRPIARLLFPEITGYDSQTFGFSIHYQEGVDTSLRVHTDASAATLNINLNLPGEEFIGSEVDFYDRNTGSIERISFRPGTAMLHKGSVAHAAQPITSGERTNIVLWLYGEGGQIPIGSNRAGGVDAKERWTKPEIEQDDVAPF